MSKISFINLENEILEGNVLDIGFNNYGIAYSLFKNNSDEICVDYIEGSGEKRKIEKNYYNSCIIFFALSSFWSGYSKKRIIKEVSENLTKEGKLYIWDVDKPFGRIVSRKLKIILPGKVAKNINIKDFNVIKAASFKSTKRLVEKYFEIIDYKYSDNIYYIRGTKREGKINESITGSS